jgi:hypothetical protein
MLSTWTLFQSQVHTSPLRFLEYPPPENIAYTYPLCSFLPVFFIHIAFLFGVCSFCAHGKLPSKIWSDQSWYGIQQTLWGIETSMFCPKYQYFGLIGTPCILLSTNTANPSLRQFADFSSSNLCGCVISPAPW